MSTGPGRPKKNTIDRKALILEAARASFAAAGYERTTIRDIAEAASVDPKLVMHYFGSKQQLFVAAVEMPAAIHNAADMLASAPAQEWGERIADLAWFGEDADRDRTMIGLIRAAASEPRAAEQLRDFYLHNVLLRLVQSLKVDAPELRAVTLSSLLIGLAFTRHIIGLQDAVAIDRDTQRQLVAQAIQSILTAPLTP